MRVIMDEGDVASCITALRHDEKKALKQKLGAFVFLAKVFFRPPYQPVESTVFPPIRFLLSFPSHVVLIQGALILSVYPHCYPLLSSLLPPIHTFCVLPIFPPPQHLVCPLPIYPVALPTIGLNKPA